MQDNGAYFEDKCNKLQQRIAKLEEENRKLSERLYDHAEQLMQNIKSLALINHSFDMNIPGFNDLLERVKKLESVPNPAQQNPAKDGDEFCTVGLLRGKDVIANKLKLSDGEFLCEFCNGIRVKIMPTHFCCEDFYNKYQNPVKDETQKPAFECKTCYWISNTTPWHECFFNRKTKTYWVNVYEEALVGKLALVIRGSEEEAKHCRNDRFTFIKCISFTIGEAE
jgi:hypothetical protein